MVKPFCLAAGFLNAFVVPAGAERIGDVGPIDLRASQKAICAEGDEKSPDTWIACGRSDAFAAVLAARRLCLDAGRGVFRVGDAAARQSHSRWHCSLVSS